MPNRSSAEYQILIAIGFAGQYEIPADARSIRKFGEEVFKENLLSWEGVFEQLITDGLLKIEDGQCVFTPKGMGKFKEYKQIEMSKRFSDSLIRTEASNAFALFCERLFGKNLCQYDMMSMNQLEKMLEILDLDKTNRVLDVGCGIGIITEYIADTTGAHCTGVDFAACAIDCNRKRSASKRDRVVFDVGDMNDLQYPNNRFDTIISIDTLYFVRDIDAVMKNLLRMTKPGGQMGIFWNEMLKEGDSRERLDGDKTRLARAVSNLGLEFTFIDYTEEEKAHWPTSLQLAKELMPQFIEEGNEDLGRSRIEESKHIISVIKRDGLARYLYHVTVM